MNLNLFLTQIEALIKSYFGEVLIWDERSTGLRGKYFYTQSRSAQVGIFLGFTINSDLSKPQKGIVFVFADPKSRILRDLTRETETLLDQILVEINQKDSLKINFVLVKGELPSLVRTINIEQENEAKAIEFFRESLLVLVKTGLLASHSRSNVTQTS